MIQKKIYGDVSIQMNRLYQPSFTPAKQFSKYTRGTNGEVLSRDGIILTQWLDKRIVYMGSNFVRIGNDFFTLYE